MIKAGLTLHRLRLFLAVLDSGGVARAAQARHLSQPAVSEHLRGLEAFFDVRLFERAGRGVRPTAAARVIEPFVRQALGLVASAEQAAIELRGPGAGSVSYSLPPPPNPLRGLAARWPPARRWPPGQGPAGRTAR